MSPAEAIKTMISVNLIVFFIAVPN